MKNIPRQVIIKPIIIIFLIWGLLFLGLIQFKAPYNFYVQQSENPWYPINADTYPEYGVSAIDFANSTHGWIGGKKGLIMATTDGGRSWYSQHSGINSTIRTLDFFDPQVGIAIDDQYGWILITQNGGINWTVLERAKYPHPRFGWTEAPLWDAKICNRETAWLLGNYGSFFWVNISSSNVIYVSYIEIPLLRLSMVNFTHGWAVGSYGNIVHTQDGWQSYETQDVGVEINFRGIFFWDVHKGWIVGEHNMIFATTDGGQHWRMQYSYRPLLGSTSLLDIFFITELQGWAVGTWGIHFTENGGASWFHFSNTSGPHRITFANRSHGWAVWARKERSYMTTIGGTLPISESTINFGVFVITLCGALTLILIVIVVNRLQEHREYKFSDNTD